MIFFKRSFVSALFLSFTLLASGQVGIGTNSPSPSAQLEVRSTNKGFLPPSVALQGTNDAQLTNPSSPRISNPATGLLVYNTATAGSGATAVTPGFYYYDGSQWTRINNGQIAEIPGWTNAGTIQSVGITGTTSAPTLPTTTQKNQVLYKQLGPKTWEVMVVLEYTSATGGTAGSGDYLFTLPNGLSFDTNIEAQQAYTGTVGASSWYNLMKAIPGCNTNILIGGNAAASYSNGGPIVWDATRYRVSATLIGSGVYCIGSGWFQFTTGNSYYSWRFTFQSL